MGRDMKDYKKYSWWANTALRHNQAQLETYEKSVPKGRLPIARRFSGG